MEIRIAQCCGSCKYVNRPQKPEEHAPHYEVAKTERWCYKHNIHITRETVCDDFEIENKKGAFPAFKRILAFNKKLEKIIEIKNWMEENKVTMISDGYCDFSIINGKMHYKYSSWENIHWYLVSSKDADDTNRLIKAQKVYLENKTK